MSNATAAPDSADGIFPYKPSQAGPIIAALLFGTSAVIHLVAMVRHRAWFYTPITIGAFMMTTGYIFRFISAKSPNELTFYIIQSMFIILPPSLYAASIYMIYGRIVLFVNAPASSIINPLKVTKIFVCGDVLAFLLQSSGGGMMAISGLAGLGQKIVVVGLVVQLAFFGFFLYIAKVFDRRMAKSPARYSIPKYGEHTWRRLLILLLYAAVIIILRCLYRVVEFGQGEKGYLMEHEVFMYLADTAPMLVVQVMFHFIYAGDAFPKGGTDRKTVESGSYIHLEGRV